MVHLDRVFRNRFHQIDRDMSVEQWFQLIEFQQDVTTVFSIPRFLLITGAKQTHDGPIVTRFVADFFEQPLGVSLDGNQYLAIKKVVDQYMARIAFVLRQVSKYMLLLLTVTFS